MWLDAPELLRGAAPGRFLMLRCADPALGWRGVLAFDPLLPRAMSYHGLRKGKNGDEFSILYDVVGRGTAWLAERKPATRFSAGGRSARATRCAATARTCCWSAAASASRRWSGWPKRPSRKAKASSCSTGRATRPASTRPRCGRTRSSSSSRPRTARPGDRASSPTCSSTTSLVRHGVHLRPEPHVRRPRRRLRSTRARSAPRPQAGAGAARVADGLRHRHLLRLRGVRPSRAPRLVCKEGPRFELRDIW